MWWFRYPSAGQRAKASELGEGCTGADGCPCAVTCRGCIWTQLVSLQLGGCARMQQPWHRELRLLQVQYRHRMLSTHTWNAAMVPNTASASSCSLDKHAAAAQLRSALVETTKQRTDPYIFINRVRWSVDTSYTEPAGCEGAY
jgi:hypothetical protein